MNDPETLTADSLPAGLHEVLNTLAEGDSNLREIAESKHLDRETFSAGSRELAKLIPERMSPEEEARILESTAERFANSREYVQQEILAKAMRCGLRWEITGPAGQETMTLRDSTGNVPHNVVEAYASRLQQFVSQYRLKIVAETGPAQ